MNDREFFINLLKVLIVSGLILGTLTFVDWRVSSNILAKYEGSVILLHLILPISIVLTLLFIVKDLTDKKILLLSLTITMAVVFFVPFLLSYMHPLTFRFLELSQETVSQLRISNQPLIPLILNFTFCGVIFLLFVLSLKLIQDTKKGFVVQSSMAVLVGLIFLFIPRFMSINSYISSPGYYLLSNLISLVSYIGTIFYFLNYARKINFNSQSVYFIVIVFLAVIGQWFYYLLCYPKFILREVELVEVKHKISEFYIFGKDWKLIENPSSLFYLGILCIIVSFIFVLLSKQSKNPFRRIIFFHIPIILLHRLGIYIISGGINLTQILQKNTFFIHSQTLSLTFLIFAPVTLIFVPSILFLISLIYNKKFLRIRDKSKTGLPPIYAEPLVISSEKASPKSSTIEAIFLFTTYFIINVVMSIGMIEF